MLRFILLFALIGDIFGSNEKVKIVDLDDGPVVGEKYWDGDFYQFFGVPYATAPTGRDKYKAPLPVKKRNELFEASVESIVCQQVFYTGDDSDEHIIQGEEDCLILNLYVPLIANENNLVPVVVYIHSGAYSGGNGNMGKLNFIARHDIIGISINYRLGALGFACLGTEDVPGNAALKDQVAALRWINKNIKKFGGDPCKVTLAGYSVGASMAELLALSKSTDGLIDKLILESGSALNPYAINRDPISTARNVAISVGFNDTGNIKDLNEFFLTGSVASLTAKSMNFFLKNSTFGFVPCIEKELPHPHPEAIVTQSPLDSLKKWNGKIAVLSGFANMEGLSRSIKFDTWSELMNEQFADFLPADLYFKDNKTRDIVIKEVFNYYFKGEEVSHDTLQGYIDFFSDTMFKYGMIKSTKMRATNNLRPLYFYEFSYVGELSMQHYFMDKITGASHRDQTAYILNFHGYTSKVRDLDTRDRMTYMWTDFIKYENPTPYESSLIDVKWLKYSNENPNYLSIGNTLEMRKDILPGGYQFWDKIYEKHYWNPSAPKIENSKK